jgi:mannose-6-phosphate isomerase-like protein (cupin superfamily)
MSESFPGADMRRRWKELVKPGHAFHVSAALDERRMPIPLHDHDFAEVTWVREGHGIHRINGRRQELHAGQIVFVRATDRHGLEALPGERYRLENVALPLATMKRFLSRYSTSKGCGLPWDRSGRSPATITLGLEQVSKLKTEILVGLLSSEFGKDPRNGSPPRPHAARLAGTCPATL